ncbi:MAG: hypothetical protein RIC35_20190 [Marinoscillum sp.]
MLTILLKITLTICLILGSGRSVKVMAQGGEAVTYVQETAMGLQKGYELRYVTRKGFGLGGFVQSSNNFSYESGKDNYPFVGTSIQIPISTCGKIQFCGELKTGLVNNRFLIATPELTTRYTLMKHVKLAISAGIRAQEAAVSAKLILTTL